MSYQVAAPSQVYQQKAEPLGDRYTIRRQGYRLVNRKKTAVGVAKVKVESKGQNRSNWP